MNKTNIDLLPQHPLSIVKDAAAKKSLLELMSFLTLETIETLKDFFIRKKLTHFDPHVGETACQLRAYHVFILNNHSDLVLKEEQLNFKLLELKQLYKKLKMQIADPHLEKNFKKNSISTHQLFSENDLLVTLSPSLIFLVHARVLTRFKTSISRMETYIDHTLVATEFNISRKLAKRFAHCYQGRLAEISCQFIFDLINDIPNLHFMEPILKNLQQSDDDHREVLPCFATMEVLIAHMRSHNTRLLLVVEPSDETLQDPLFLYCFTKEGNLHYKLIDELSTEEIEGSAFVVKGTANYNGTKNINSKQIFLEQLVSLGVDKILLANMAAHAQFSGNKLKELYSNPYKDLQLNSHGKLLADQFLTMKKLALKKGCCLENNSLFLVEHIFCDIIKNQISIDSTFSLPFYIMDVPTSTSQTSNIHDLTV